VLLKKTLDDNSAVRKEPLGGIPHSLTAILPVIGNLALGLEIRSLPRREEWICMFLRLNLESQCEGFPVLDYIFCKAMTFEAQ
jgi:hypothetical protein